MLRERSALGVLIVVVRAAVLLVRFSSKVVVATVTVLVTSPVLSAAMLAVNSSVPEVPTLMSPKFH